MDLCQYCSSNMDTESRRNKGSVIINCPQTKNIKLERESFLQLKLTVLYPPSSPIPAGQGAGCAGALQTSALFGQSAGQTKSKRDTSQKQWMRILTRYKVFSCAPHRLRPQIMLCSPHAAHPVNQERNVGRYLFFIQWLLRVVINDQKVLLVTRQARLMS